MSTMTKNRPSASVRGSYSFREEGSHRGQKQPREHTPVMPQEALRMLAPQKGEVIVDATYGQGGHSALIKKAAKVKLIAIDADPAAGTGVIEGNFGDLESILKKLGVERIDKALFDLGWNLGQLASGRGFSFLVDEPLNMSYGTEPRSGFTAAEILNTWKEKTIADVLFGYGEERYARRIARAIVERREIEPFKTTLELAECVRDAVPPAYRRGRLHPATKTFQALRIAVNHELGVIDEGLSAAWKHLSAGGRIVVITFHSIEDRAVKRLFQSWAKGGAGELLSKKPLVPSQAEIRRNPPSRSAKLRGIQKI